MRHDFRSHSPRDRARYLATLPFARTLDADAIMTAAFMMRESQFDPEEVLVAQGHPVSNMYIVTSGRLSLWWGDRRLAEIEAPGRFGLTDLLAEGRADTHGASCDIVAETRVETLALPAEVVDHLLAANNDFLFGLIRWYADRLLAEHPRLDLDPAADEKGEAGGEFTLVGRVRWLRNTPLFSHSRLSSLFELAEGQRVVRRADGDWLWRAGRRAETLWGIVAGGVELTGPGAAAMAGLLEPIAGGDHAESARVTEPLTALALPVDTLWSVIETNIDTGIELVRALASLLVEHRRADNRAGWAADEEFPRVRRYHPSIGYGRFDSGE